MLDRLRNGKGLVLEFRTIVLDVELSMWEELLSYPEHFFPYGFIAATQSGNLVESLKNMTYCCGHNLPQLYVYLRKNILGTPLNLRYYTAISIYKLIFLLAT